ncbi:MAG: DNRLRE domain-containing protein, partial [Bacteroidales bacterium]|nr:DNRLRE domain-containing protein [Bacteroidales bacterium]
MNSEFTNKLFRKPFIRLTYGLALFAMLHSTLVYPASQITSLITGEKPCQIIENNPVERKQTGKGSTKVNDPLAKAMTSDKKVKEGSTAISTDSHGGVRNTQPLIFTADLAEGTIGVTANSNLDSPSDNLFLVDIDEELMVNDKIFLCYDVFGVSNPEGISRSINQRPASGGYLAITNDRWTSIKEELPGNWIKKGENQFLFTALPATGVSYRIKNLRVEIEAENDNCLVEQNIVIQNQIPLVTSDGKVYIRGFVKGVKDEATVEIGEQVIPISDGFFEAFADVDRLATENNLVVKAKDSRGVLGQVCLPVESGVETVVASDFKQAFLPATAPFDPISLPGYLETTGASIVLTEGCLHQRAELSIRQLRNQDLPPMGSGMVNVTPGRSGYRYTPDGMTFDKPAQISIAYDSTLIPSGYTPEDIRTFFFNTSSKKWEMVRMDTIDRASRTVTSFTSHFTDYVNGIIQVPESPQTSGFTTTMMNDIKAADPSANITLISPPEASQTGDANISYPIKIPAGRKGMQPQLALQYSSGGGDSWTGTGWNLTIPAISIDTRWGVPTFGDKNSDGDYNDAGENIETEIYSLAGEQLMYPKLEVTDGFVDWMPHRHYEEVPGVYSTVDRPRIDPSNANFTFRKQGSFAKIQRLGSSPSTYYWKVTETDGTIKWYGGKTASDVANSLAVTKNPHGDIVYWALFMVEDVYGNNIKYTYETDLFPSTTGQNANLSGGRFFYPTQIVYTGHNATAGNYKIEFVRNEAVKPDVSLNARMGFKQVDPYLLERINVKYQNQLVRYYELEYTTGRFNKTLLQKIAEFDKDGNLFYDHTFEYYDDLMQDEQVVYFSGPVIQNICPDECYEVTFPIPYSQNLPIYHYSLSSNYELSYGFQCAYPGSVAKVHSYTINGVEYTPSTDNLYVTHFLDGSVQNLCPPIGTPGIYYGIQNTEFTNSLSKWLYEQTLHTLSPFNILVTNNSRFVNPYYKLPIYFHYLSYDCSFYSDVLSSGYSMFYIQGYGTSFRDDLSVVQESIATGITCEVVVTTSIGAHNFGNYNFSDSYYIDKFITDFTQEYPGVPSPTITNSNGSIYIYIPNTNANSTFISITLTGGGISNTYDFNTCGDNISDNNNKGWERAIASKEEISYEINKMIADGKELDKPITEVPVHLIVNLSPESISTSPLKEFTITSDTINWGDYFDFSLKEGNYLLTITKDSSAWQDNEGKVIKDFKALNVLNGLLNTDKAALYEEFQKQHRISVMETRHKAMAQASERLQKSRLGAAEAIEISTSGSNQLAKLINKGKNKKATYIDNLTNRYKAYFRSTQGPTDDDEDCGPITNNGFLIQTILPSFNSAASMLGSTEGKNFSLGGYLGLGIGWNHFTKLTTFGLQYSKGWNSTDARLSMVDIDGDGLEDIVVKDGDQIYYKKHLVTRIYDENNQPHIHHSFSTNRLITGITNYFKQKGTSSSWNFQATFGMDAVGGFVGTDHAKSKSENTIYFTDANGDGLIDIVKNGTVFFNRLINNIPFFEADSKYTENLVITAAGSQISTPPEYYQTEISFPDNDVVKVWEAPADGKIQIENHIELTDHTKSAIVTIEIKKNDEGINTSTGLDAMISNYPANQNNNYGWLNHIHAARWTKDGTLMTQRFLIDFDLSNIPSGSTINSAALNLYGVNTATSTSPGNGYSQYKSPATSNNSYIRRVTSAWSENAVTWNNQPTTTTVNQVELPSLQSTPTLLLNFENIDITNLIQDIIDNPVNSHGIMISMANESQEYRRIVFASSEYSDVQKHPKLEISFTPPGGKGNLTENGCGSSTEDPCLLFGTTLNYALTTVDNIISTNSSPCNPDNTSIFVRKGDRIYFRIHNVSNGNPPVNWNPKVEYTNTSLAAITDQNGLTPYSSQYSDGFILSGESGSIFPGDGTATISWDPVQVSNLTDQVTFEIVKAEFTGTSQEPTTQTVLFTQTCNAGTTQTVESTNLSTVTVTGNTATPPVTTVFYFNLKANSNVNWKQIEWRPKIVSTVATEVIGADDEPEGTLTTEQTDYPVVSYDIYKSFACSAPYSPYNLESSGAPYEITPSLSGLFNSSDEGTIHFIVKGNNALIGTREITVSSGTVSISPSGNITIPYNCTAIEIGFYTDDSKLDQSSTSLLERIALTPDPVVSIISGSNTISVMCDEVNLFQKPNPRFGPMYRQWGQFMYNPDAVEDALSLGTLPGYLIKEEALEATEAQANSVNQAVTTLQNAGYNQVNLDDPTSLENFENSINQFQTNTSSLLNIALVTARPSRTFLNNEYNEKWVGFHDECFSSALSSRAAGYSQAFEGFINEDDETVQGVINTGAYGINKYSVNSGRNVSAGVNIGVGAAKFGITGSKSLDGQNQSLTDYADMNGDRYPDLVSTQQVQITNRTGGLFTVIARDAMVNGVILSSQSNSWGGGATGSYSGGGKSGGGGKGEYLKFDIPRLDLPSGNSSIGLSGNFSLGNETTSRTWADINGDGLSDLLVRSGDNVTVSLNYGNNVFGTGQQQSWGDFYLIKGSSKNLGGGAGFSYASGSAEAGISINTNTSGSEYMIADINGDGLMDVIRSADNKLHVAINNGSTFNPEIADYFNFSLTDNASSVNASANLGITVSWVTPIFFIPLKFPCINANSQYSTSTNKTLKSITDFDGDGFPDLLEELNATTVKVWYSNIRRTNKLKTVHNPLGGEFTIDYRVADKDYNNPNTKWVMSEVTVSDGYNLSNDGEDVYRKSYSYENGRYDRREREFYGFETVKASDFVKDDNNHDVLYRVGVTKYHNSSYFLNGLMVESYVYKGKEADKIFSKQENTYQLKALTDDNLHVDPASSLPLSFDVGGTEGRKSAIALLTESTTSVYELGTNPVVSKVTMQYDEKGRVASYTNQGDVSVADDNYTSTITYHDIATLTAKNMVAIPETITVTNNNGTIMRQRSTSDIDPQTGDIGKIVASIDEDGNTAETELDYDSYGNLNKVILPANSTNQRMQYQWTYDATNHKHVHTVTDAFGYSTVTLYDARFDVPTLTTDMCGNSVSYHYDAFGRLVRIVGPNEAMNTPVPFTLRFEYFPLFANVTASPTYQDCITQADFVPVAITLHYDCQHPDNPIETYTFIDGLARPVQVKKDIEINQNPDRHGTPVYVEMMSVSGKVAYDLFGRAVEQRHPVYESKKCQVSMLVNSNDSPYHSITDYDEMDRAVKTTDPDGNFTTTDYSVAAGKMVTHTETDQNGVQTVINETHKDASGNVVRTINVGPMGDVMTSFVYNAIGELMSYTDADNLSSVYTYDRLGRKTSFLHPDNGLTSYVYDKAGNLIQLQTANLAVNSQFVNYAYHYNRLASVTFPPVGGSTNISNVSYQYGAPGDGNMTGRLTELSDATGTRSYKYGKMGEIVSENRVVVAPTPLLPTRTFTTLFTYDSWNRLISQLYPDGETVGYQYDKGGNLIKITGSLNGSPYEYLKRVDYDHYEQRTFAQYGNNTETFYDYSPSMRRLQTLAVKASTQQEMMNNAYVYDKIGNITSLTNLATYSTSNGMGGNLTNTYQYDVLNRLTSASGTFAGDRVTQPPLGNDFYAVYTLAITYSNTGRINTKNQWHELNGTAEAANTYQHSYSYVAGKHQVEQ